MFDDSSLEVFCSVAFLCAQKRIECQVEFVWDEARAAPMKMLSITKTELQAELFAIRIKIAFEKTLTLNVCKVIMRTESSTALKRLKLKSKQLMLVPII